VREKKSEKFRLKATVREITTAVNEPVRDNARKGAVKKRTQLKSKLMGKSAWTRRDKTSGEFMAVKKRAKNSRESARRAHKKRRSRAVVGTVFGYLRSRWGRATGSRD
jgi:hypothetical protein